MSRTRRVCAVVVLLTAFVSGARAEEPAALVEELRALRQLVEQQTKQLDTLTRQVAKLAGTGEGKTSAKSDPAAPAEPDVTVSAPATTQPAAPAPDEFVPVRKAEAAGPPKHVVVKGETLTSIAKHYNIPLAELHKANKDVNERKLQIGQTLSIPSTATPPPKPAEPVPEKTP